MYRQKGEKNLADNEEMLSQQDLYDLLKFASQIYTNDPYGYFTPQTSNQILTDINNNPEIPTKENYTRVISNYKDNTETLQAYSEFMEAFDMLYKRLVYYYSDMLAFDLDIECTNAYAPNRDYKSKEYKEDLQRVYKFLTNFDYKAEFQKITRQLTRRQTYFVWLRDTQGNFEANGEINLNDTKGHKTSKYTLQPMPQKRCKIVDRWEYGYLYDVDMTYFTQGGVSLDSYDPIFRKYWKETFQNGDKKYIPTQPLDNRYGTFAMWTQTSPEEGAWVFTMDESNISTTPFLVPNIINFLNNKEIEGLQKDKDMLSAKALLAGDIQVRDNQKSGSATDSTVYNLKTLVKLLALVKRGLNNNINAVAMPTGSPKLWQFTDSNANMVKNTVDNSVAQSASASRIIYSSDKMSETEAKNAVVTDYLMISQLYSQFNHFLDFFVNKKTRKYKFKFTLSGSTYPFMREDDVNRYTMLMDKGIVFAPRTYAKILGMTPMEFDRLLEEGKYSEWTNDLTSMLTSIYTQSGNKDSNATGGMGSQNGGGRPTESDAHQSDKTAES